MNGFRVTETIWGAHPKLDAYPLLPGDLLVQDDDGTWGKEAPGLAVFGFVLNEEQVETLRPVEFGCAGLSYWET